MTRSLSSEPVVIIASSEFTLKSAPVRRTLEQRLLDDIRTALTRAGIENLRPEKHAGRIVIRGPKDAETVTHACSKVFGVAYAAHGLLAPASMDDILQAVVQLASSRLENGQTFAVRAHRSGPTSISRRDVEIRGGSEILAKLKQRGVRVDLSQPDVTVFVDLADDRAYVYSQKVPGPGGLPISSEWKMLAVLDSGPLSILAAYSMMRRGCVVELFIPISGHIKIFAREYQLDLAQKLRQLVTRSNYRAYTFELDDLPESAAPGAALTYADGRQYARDAALNYAREKRFKGIVLADVAGNLDKIQSEFPGAIAPPALFHPLIGLDKDDLIQLSREVEISSEDLGWVGGEMIQEEATGRSVSLRKGPTEFVKPVLL